MYCLGGSDTITMTVDYNRILVSDRIVVRHTDGVLCPALPDYIDRSCISAILYWMLARIIKLGEPVCAENVFAIGAVTAHRVGVLHQVC